VITLCQNTADWPGYCLPWWRKHKNTGPCVWTCCY